MSQSSIISFLFICNLFGCYENTDPALCDPKKGNFIRGTHFISDEFLTEDGNWNYNKWNEYRREASKFRPDPNCINLAHPKSAEEQILELEKVTDLTR